MIFQAPLLKGSLIKRYKRFLADIELESGTFITAHCPNSGAMQGLTDPGTPVWVSRAANLSRKLPYTWEMAKIGDTYVGMNTSNPNHLVEEALRNGVIQELQGYKTLRREVPYGQNSRVDFLLESSTQSITYVEVKNVHLRRGDVAAFPSSVTARGAKHMRELTEMVRKGHQSYIVYVVQRNDCAGFEIADDIDPTYGKETRNAFENGVIPLVYACEVTPHGITLTHRINFTFRK